MRDGSGANEEPSDGRTRRRRRPRRGDDLPDAAEADLTDTADVFGLPADPGRLRLLMALPGGELWVCDLAVVARLSESAASHALRLFRAHRVVSVRRAGRMAYYRLDDAHVRMLLDLAVAHTEHTAAVHPETGHQVTASHPKATYNQQRLQISLSTTNRKVSGSDGPGSLPSRAIRSRRRKPHGPDPALRPRQSPRSPEVIR